MIHLLSHLPHMVTKWPGRIQQDHERFSQFFQFFNRTFLSRPIIVCRNISKASVTGHHDANGRMIMYDLMSSHLGSFGKRNLFRKPRCLHHAFRIIFQMSGCTIYHITYAVNQSNLHRNLSAHIDLDSILGYKLWLCRHDRLSCCRLRKLIHRPPSLMHIFYIRKHQKIHKTLDECGFSCTDRANHTYVDLPSCPFFDIIV